jgi:hypothetical protein
LDLKDYGPTPPLTAKLLLRPACALFCLDKISLQLASHPGKGFTKLLNVVAWQLLKQLGSKVLLRFPFVLGRHKAGFDCPNIWHSPIFVWQLPESLLAENLF